MIQIKPAGLTLSDNDKLLRQNRNGRERALELPWNNYAVTNASFSPDGAWVVTASGTAARVWDAASGTPIGKPLQHQGSVNSAVFNHNGTRVVTSSDDKTAQIWDVTTTAPIGQAFQHDDAVASAWFSPDGDLVETVSKGKTSRVWVAPPAAPNIVATACKMLGCNRETASLSTRYGIDVKDPICTGVEPVPDPSLMIDQPRLSPPSARPVQPGVDPRPSLAQTLTPRRGS
jgi:WD40 repeat protein